MTKSSQSWLIKFDTREYYPDVRKSTPTIMRQHLMKLK